MEPDERPDWEERLRALFLQSSVFADEAQQIINDIYAWHNEHVEDSASLNALLAAAKDWIKVQQSAYERRNDPPAPRTVEQHLAYMRVVREDDANMNEAKRILNDEELAAVNEQPEEDPPSPLN